MYNRIYQYFKENDMLFPKPFFFQVNDSTHHEILNLTDDILEYLKKVNSLTEEFLLIYQNLLILSIIVSYYTNKNPMESMVNV